MKEHKRADRKGTILHEAFELWQSVARGVTYIPINVNDGEVYISDDGIPNLMLYRNTCLPPALLLSFAKHSR